MTIISIHAPHAGRDFVRYDAAQSLSISIHAPHAGRDSVYYVYPTDERHFNPRAPCGARPRASAKPPLSILFQSTRPMRGATAAIAGLLLVFTFQSTRPMRGATRTLCRVKKTLQISIHAPHAGRDSKSIQNYFTHFCDKRQFLDNFTQNAAF